MSDSAIYCLECISRNFYLHEQIQNDTLNMIYEASSDKSVEFRDKFECISRRNIMKVFLDMNRSEYE